MQGFEFYTGNISTELMRIFHPKDFIIIIVKTPTLVSPSKYFFVRNSNLF